ncbi:hypothetical protein P7C71_g5390, partial [Lecanoromycetidae sp. Uapishka_2]
MMTSNKIAVYSVSEPEQRLELSSPFTCCFDVDGFFIAKPFQQWLASEVPLVGQVDPQNREKLIADGEMEAIAVLVEQKYDTPKKEMGRETGTLGTKSRRGKKPDR